MNLIRCVLISIYFNLKTDHTPFTNRINTFQFIIATKYITSNTPITAPVEPTDILLSSTTATMGPKRGRLLIRQPRVKRDSDSTSATSSIILSQQSPDIEIDPHPPTLHFTTRLLTSTHPQVPPPRHTTDPFVGSSSAVSATNLTTSQHHSHHLHYPLHIYHQTAPSSSSSHLLTVPESNIHTTTLPSTHTPFLIKQHSHPLLLPSQSSLDLPSVTAGSHHSLHRQLSYPTTSSDNQNLMLPLGGISLTGSPSIITTSSSATTSIAHLIERSDSIIKMEEEEQTATAHHQQQQSTTVGTQHHHGQVQNTPSIVVVSEHVQLDAEQPSTAVGTGLGTNTSNDSLLPSIRIKGEELQRSISSPLVSYECLYGPFFTISQLFSP